MSNRPNPGGRVFPYEPGSPDYNNDEFRGQRRRPWMSFRFGDLNPELTTEACMQFVERVRVTIIDKGVLLDDERSHLKYCIIGTDFRLLQEELEHSLRLVRTKYEDGPMSRPVVITVIDNLSCEDKNECDHLIAGFSDFMYFIKFTATEILEMIDQGEYDSLDVCCFDFARYVHEIEAEIPETVACRIPVEEPVHHFGAGFDESSEKFSQLSGRGNRSMNRNRHNYHQAPPGLPPPGLHPRQSPGPPPGLSRSRRDRDHEEQLDDLQKQRDLSPPPGLSRNRDSNQPSTSKRNITPVPPPAKDILSYDDVLCSMGYVQKIERGKAYDKHNLNQLAIIMTGIRIDNRFDVPFSSAHENVDLLQLVNYAISSRDKKTHKPAKTLIISAFDRSFPTKLRENFLEFPYRRWNEDDLNLLFELVMFHFYSSRYDIVPTLFNFWQSFIDLAHSFEAVRNHLPDGDAKTLRKKIAKVEEWYRDAADKTNAPQNFVNDDGHYRDHYPDDERRRDTGSRGPNHAFVEEDRHQPQQYNDYQHRYDDRRPDSRQNRNYDYGEPNRNGNDNYWQDEDHHDHRDYERSGRDEVDHARRDYDYDNHSNHPASGFHRDGGAVYEEKVFEPRYEEPMEPQQIEEFNHQKEEEVEAILQHDSDAKEAQPYKFSEVNEENYEPLWMKAEITEPPEDFKTLPTIPVLSDYVNSKIPYVRRIQENGIYKSAAHYLDVQFRLLREDLISPMRDGIDIYRKNGTSKGNRLNGQISSDISIFRIDRVDGKQVTERDGLEMRIAWPSSQEIAILTDNEREMKEMGLMMLSDDGFVDDFHLTIVNLSLLSTKGCIHLEILEETAPFKTNKGYQMAQAQSYLPSYKHVLENMKNINPFKPIPFERYIVRGKKTIFRPRFHRHEKDEEQESEEKKLIEVYNEIRSIASGKRLVAGKPIPRGGDDEDDDDHYYMANQKKAKEEEDLEYDQLKEPIFRVLPSMADGVPSGSDQIIIGKKWYRISKLLDDFQPDYLDESQRVAFCQTFRNEFSLIQGPPGTGKTHIGVQIIKTMLQNRTHWRMIEPILIVCYTNSGLDNLLERVLQMIEDDEELSKDNGKPKMIRYGRKSASDYLKRQNVLRFDVHDMYKTSLPEQLKREQDKAGRHKRNKGKDLAAASFALYCSRRELLSYNSLAPVMDKDHQAEVLLFASEHVDSKGKVLCPDEAIACWLLEQDFGKATKQQIKKQNKSKFSKMPEDEEDEMYDYEEIEDDGDENLSDENILDKLFNKMNMDCTGKQVLDELPDDSSEYYSNGIWEIVNDDRPDVVLMGIDSKGGLPVDEHIQSLVNENKQLILASQPVPEKDLENIKYIYSLARPKRWSLYVTWCRKLRQLIAVNLPRHISIYRKACVEMQKVFNKVDAEFMKMPMVIGATTSCCSRIRPLLEMVQPRILVVEEAAEVLEGHIVSSMISTIEHAVMIGDHQQLRPHPAVHELGTEYGLQISMFERLVAKGLPYCQLKQQHRMNTNISDLIVKHAFYSNVTDAPNVMEYPAVEGMKDNLFFWLHTQREESPDGVSYLNRREAEMSAALVQYLLKQSYSTKDIVVLSTYAAQRNYMLREFCGIFGDRENNLVPVETVDSYQGKESKLVILSLVRSHRGLKVNTGVGFLAVANRICVALTRAQHGLYVIGNGRYIENNAPLWKKINMSLGRRNLIEYELTVKCTAHNKLSEIEVPLDFAKKCPEGGCDEICNIKKPCGHVCLRNCHPNFELDHQMDCQYQCILTCPNKMYNHKCAKKCYEDCGNCMTFVETTLDCGHTTTTPCSKISMARCNQKCSKTLECGHICMNICGTECTTKCQEAVEIDLKCGHKKKLTCFSLTSDSADFSCIERCENRMLSCDHQCAELCGAQCTVECRAEVIVKLKCGHSQSVECCNIASDESTDHIPCETVVPQTLKPCEHIGHVPCGKPPSSEYCTERCKANLECKHTCGDECGKCFKNGKHICQQRCQKLLPCGHPCSAKCGEECPPCIAFCATTCQHQCCGGGNKGYGRSCNEICAMCPANCGNICRHRSCSKRCFEPCNVKPCEQRCEKLLPCKHACLGMCGEECPKICGTCQREKYVELVASLKDSQVVHPIIMIPKCLHLFPAQILDAHVIKLKSKNKQLICPSCNGIFTNIKRYVQYEKERIYQINVEKMKANAQGQSFEAYVASIQQNAEKALGLVKRLDENAKGDMAEIWFIFGKNITNLIQRLQKIEKQDKYRLNYILHISKCCLVIAQLANSAREYRSLRKNVTPPSVDSLMCNFQGTPPFLINSEIIRVNKYLATFANSDMLGVVMPSLRESIAKMTIFTQLVCFGCTMTSLKTDISESDRQIIGRTVNRFLQNLEKCSLDESIVNSEEVLLKFAPSMVDRSSYHSWKSLRVPRF